MNLSRFLLIKGTKKIIHKKTVGHASKNLLNHRKKKFSGELKKTITADTVVLVQKDIITAKIINLFFFINLKF